MAQYSEQEIFDKVLEISGRYLPELKKEDITMDSVVNRDMGADSMNFVLIITKLEGYFDIRFPDRGWEKLSTVGDVVHAVERLLKKQSS